MTGEGKLLKLTCLAALFMGVASMVCGAIFVVGNLADTDAWITAGEGLLASVYGVRTSILANVPSNTSKIRGKAVILALVAAAVIAAFAVAGLDVQIVQTCLAAVVFVLAAIGFIMASRIVKEQLRK